MAKKIDAEEAARAAAAYFGRMGGRKSRANMTAEQRSASARAAGIARARAAGQTVKAEEPNPRAVGYQDFRVTKPSVSVSVVDVNRAAVLVTLRGFGQRGTSLNALATFMKIAADDKATRDRLKNTLSSLRTAGKVKSEPMPGSAREKLWRVVT